MRERGAFEPRVRKSAGGGGQCGETGPPGWRYSLGILFIANLF